VTQNETKLLESAVALSEERNFTRAARKINISQSALTKNLKQLERLLGIRLFERDKKLVRITVAGQAYVDQARLALLYGERAVQAARAAAQHAEHILNVGRSPYSDPFFITTLLSIQRQQFPTLKFDFSSQFSSDLVNAVLLGTLDCAIVIEPPESSSLSIFKLNESIFYIVMSERDPLAQRSSISFADLARRSWVLFNREFHPPLYDRVLQLARDRDVPPTELRHAMTPEEVYAFVADGSCIALQTKPSALRIARSGVTLRPLCEPTLALATSLVCSAANESRLLSEVVRAFMSRIGQVTSPSVATAPTGQSAPAQAPQTEGGLPANVVWPPCPS
jgi:DNA-binding transcriptional LysR family regulator